ncbi:hypothetical protein CDD83_1398 [Cordyceps sp. RAO-2017]|nr:hypothetical protein CDD83_1398 [Cordyceps sp. RAO-2017]
MQRIGVRGGDEWRARSNTGKKQRWRAHVDRQQRRAQQLSSFLERVPIDRRAAGEIRGSRPASTKSLSRTRPARSGPATADEKLEDGNPLLRSQPLVLYSICVCRKRAGPARAAELPTWDRPRDKGESSPAAS